MQCVTHGQNVSFHCSFVGNADYLNLPEEDKPFTMLAGVRFTSPMRSSISSALVDMEIGDTKLIEIPADEAFVDKKHALFGQSVTVKITLLAYKS